MIHLNIFDLCGIIATGDILILDGISFLMYPHVTTCYCLCLLYLWFRLEVGRRSCSPYSDPLLPPAVGHETANSAVQRSVETNAVLPGHFFPGELAQKAARSVALSAQLRESDD